jgi:hypothetical protein
MLTTAEAELTSDTLAKTASPNIEQMGCFMGWNGVIHSGFSHMPAEINKKFQNAAFLFRQFEEFPGGTGG